MKKTVLLLAVVISIIACSKKTVPTSNSQFALMDDQAQQGYNLAKSKCASCHGFKLPYNYSKEKWDKVLPVMYKKAKMTDTTEQKLIDYFVYNNLEKPAMVK